MFVCIPACDREASARSVAFEALVRRGNIVRDAHSRAHTHGLSAAAGILISGNYYCYNYLKTTTCLFS